MFPTALLLCEVPLKNQSTIYSCTSTIYFSAPKNKVGGLLHKDSKEKVLALEGCECMEFSVEGLYFCNFAVVSQYYVSFKI